MTCSEVNADWVLRTYLFKDLAPQLYLSSVDKCSNAFVTEIGNSVSLKIMNMWALGLFLW